MSDSDLVVVTGADGFIGHALVAHFDAAGRPYRALVRNVDPARKVKFGVRALEFDGRADSLFHPYDVAGRRHMEYIADHGSSADVPVDEILEIFTREYPGLTAADASPTRFRVEAEELRSREESAS